jgi:hypothetical protein
VGELSSQLDGLEANITVKVDLIKEKITKYCLPLERNSPKYYFSSNQN